MSWSDHIPVVAAHAGFETRLGDSFTHFRAKDLPTKACVYSEGSRTTTARRVRELFCCHATCGSVHPLPLI